MDDGTEHGLRRNVALMRELGVVEWFGIKLGPEPRPLVEARPTIVDRQAKRKAAEARAEAMLFAAVDGFPEDEEDAT